MPRAPFGKEDYVLEETEVPTVGQASAAEGLWRRAAPFVEGSSMLRPARQESELVPEGTAGEVLPRTRREDLAERRKGRKRKRKEKENERKRIGTEGKRKKRKKKKNERKGTEKDEKRKMKENQKKEKRKGRKRKKEKKNEGIALIQLIPDFIHFTFPFSLSLPISPSPRTPKRDGRGRPAPPPTHCRDSCARPRV